MACTVWLLSVATTFNVARADREPVLAAENVHLKVNFPVDGQWSIGCGWQNESPASWHHASAQHVERIDEWIIASGQVETPDGSWSIRDAMRPVRDGLIQFKRRWLFLGEEPSGRVTLSVRFQVDTAKPRPFLPGIQYYGNPSGTRRQERRP